MDRVGDQGRGLGKEGNVRTANRPRPCESGAGRRRPWPRAAAGCWGRPWSPSLPKRTSRRVGVCCVCALESVGWLGGRSMRFSFEGDDWTTTASQPGGAVHARASPPHRAQHAPGQRRGARKGASMETLGGPLVGRRTGGRGQFSAKRCICLDLSAGPPCDAHTALRKVPRPRAHFSAACPPCPRVCSVAAAQNFSRRGLQTHPSKRGPMPRRRRLQCQQCRHASTRTHPPSPLSPPPTHRCLVLGRVRDWARTTHRTHTRG